MPQSFVFRTIELDGQYLRTAVRPGSSSLPPLLIFNGIGANVGSVYVIRALKKSTIVAGNVDVLVDD